MDSISHLNQIYYLFQERKYIKPVVFNEKSPVTPKNHTTSIIEKEALKIQSFINLTRWLGMSRQV